MKITIIVSALALNAAVAQAAQSQDDYPGICTSTEDCTTYGSNYACTSVDSSVAGLENLSMCIPGGMVCSGSISGSCPTFSAWPKAYRAVQPVCVLVPVPNCNKKITVSNDTSTNGTITTTGNGTVECYSKSFTSGNTTMDVDGIYQCVDYTKVLLLNYFYIPELATNATSACAYSSSDKTLCSSQGTCAPTASFGQNYECKCNKGYDGTANCSSITSNECSSLGQCGTLGTCTVTTNATTGMCSCEAGSKGKQCTECDANSSAACSGNGTCGSDGKCTCKTGYSGTFCTDGSTTPTPATTSTPASGAEKSFNWPSVLATAVATVMTVAGVGAMAFT